MRDRNAGTSQRRRGVVVSLPVSSPSSSSGSALCVSIIAARRSVERCVTIGICPVSVARAADPTRTCGRVSRSWRMMSARMAVPGRSPFRSISCKDAAAGAAGVSRSPAACRAGGIEAGGAESSSSASMTSTTAMVMLSGEPPARVSSTRVFTQSRISLVSRMTCSTMRSLSTAFRPSEQSSQRSPGTASNCSRSSSGLASTSPRTRISTFLCGWISASSGRRRPSSMRRCTKVWSVVICVNTPSLRR